MAKVLFAWELGQGWGHITVLKPLAERLVAMGHEVTFVVRNLAVARMAMNNQRVSFFQAPLLCGRVNNAIEPPLCTLAHIMHNTAFGDTDVLRGFVSGWKSLFDLVSPDLCVFDHSPSALLAAWAYEFRKAVVGVGFCCPSLVSPFPNWRPDSKKLTQQLLDDEQAVLANANHVLRHLASTPLERLADLYAQADRTLLTSIRELDPFENRNGAHKYYGGWSDLDGVPARWRSGKGTRLFCYLKRFTQLPRFLKMLSASGCSTIAYVSGVSRQLRDDLSSQTLRIESQPVALGQVAAECDAAILHAGHGTTVYLLLRGKPLLLLPRQLEQRLTTDRVVGLECGVGANIHDFKTLETGFGAFRDGMEVYKRGAQRLARQYESWCYEEQADRAVAELATLL